MALIFASQCHAASSVEDIVEDIRNEENRIDNSCKQSTG
jgi:hypothetical protein